MTVDVRRRHERFHTTTDWLDSWHSFSFGPHYDPANTHHGLLLVNNDDVIRPSAGFPTHAHQDMEIVTWVLAGELEHRDSTGTVGRIYPGLAQRMSAGRGIRHSEANPSPADELHLVQMWVLPDTTGVDPGYEERDLTAELGRGGLVAVASGRDHDGALHLHQREATLWVARLAPGEEVAVPDARHVHVFVARGAAAFGGPGGDTLAAGDAARLTDAGTRTLTGGEDGGEILIWETA
ncbi:MAG TPA: pirin family protein [Acidimicrobiia bacterium]